MNPPSNSSPARPSREARRLVDRAGKVSRAAISAALRTYRRILPMEVRILIPEGVRQTAKWSLGIKDPIVRIEELRRRLNDLGFVERALNEFNQLTEGAEPIERDLAIWNLAVWHANRGSPESAAAALALLDKGLDEIAQPELRRREAILRAECHAVLGNIKAGRSEVAKALAQTAHADLFLAAANLSTNPSERIAHINRALALYKLPCVALQSEGNESIYDALTVTESLPTANGPKISVIIPAFNAAEHISTALNALSAQTWRNLEVLVVDDDSSDATAEIVTSFAERDERIKLIRAGANRGSYVARNIGLGEASGDFVTTHDSDDWSHPNKLETQARHLVSNPRAAANMSQQARSTSDLFFYRRGHPGHYIFDNMSSLMFRREAALQKLGYWDSVRFGADSEFIERIRLTFGRSSVASLSDAGPLSFQRQLDTSLTGSSVFGYHGFLMGARLAYHQASRRHHRARQRRYAFPQDSRPFAVPEPMRPVREVAKGQTRAFDVILVSDFRLPRQVKTRALAHIDKEREQGRSIGLVQMARYEYDPAAPVRKEFRALEDQGKVQFIVAGEHAVCERLVVLHAPVLEDFQRFMPDIKAKTVDVLLREPPKALASSEALEEWLEGCMKNATRYFGSAGNWNCLDPIVQTAISNAKNHLSPN